MLTAQVHCATPVVGICSLHFENRATKRLKNWICTYQIGREIHPFIFVLNIGPRPKYLPNACLYFFMLSVFHILQPFYGRKVRNRQYRTSFFLIKILRFSEIGKSKQSSFSHDLVSTLVYEPLDLGSRFSGPLANVRCQLLVPIIFLPLIIHLALPNGA